MPAWLWLVPLISGLATAGLTAVVRRYALARAVLDVPNERSSHSTPTPRGGGLAIVAVVLGGMMLLALTGFVATRLATGVVGAGLLVACVGWRDDRQHVSAAVRAAVHAIAAAWLVGWMGGLPAIHWGTSLVTLGPAGSALAVIAVVWSVNLFNFMDGIDGIAGVEAASVSAIVGALALQRGHAGIGALAWVVAGSSAGFLTWNWPPARIFLGDVGSGFLGLIVAALALGAERTGALSALTVALLMGVFVVDATVTLLRRVARGERWYSAHRSHAYQRAVQSGQSHRATTLAVAGANAVLGVLAWLAETRRIGMGAAGLLALVGLVLLYAAVEAKQPMFPRAPDGRG